MLLRIIFAIGSIAVRGNQYGPGVGLIYLDDLECSGTESSLLDCEHRGLSVSNCYHHQDAAVICKNNSKWIVLIKLYYQITQLARCVSVTMRLYL